MKLFAGLVVALAILAATPAHAGIVITEWMYNASGPGDIGEYVELTNTGGAPVDMTGWSFDDNGRSPGAESLTGLGVVQPGQSVIFTDDSAAGFASNWGLSGVTVLGGNTNNLGRNDEINIYDATNTLVDRLTYNDQAGMGPRTQNASGNPLTPAVVGANTATQWVLATNGDAYGSYTSARGERGNPGHYLPEPATAFMALIGGLALIRRR